MGKPKAGAAELTRRARRGKRKGRAHERSTAEEIAEWLGLEAGTDPDCPVQWSRASFSGRDVTLTKAAVEALGHDVWLECKNAKTLAIPAWLKQIEDMQRTAKDGGEPVLVFKLHGVGDKKAVIRFEFLMRLLTEALQFKRERDGG